MTVLMLRYGIRRPSLREIRGPGLVSGSGAWGVAGPAPDGQPRASAGEARHVRAALGKMMDAGVSRGPLWSTFPSSTPGRDTRCVHPGPEGDEDRGELLPFSLGNTGSSSQLSVPFYCVFSTSSPTGPRVLFLSS